MRNDTNKPELVKDLLITHYLHLSRLWEWRDRLRTSFLRYYFIVLGGVIIVIGYTARSKNESILSLLNGS